MIGKTGQTSEETAEALRSRLAGLPGWTQTAGGQTVAQWLVALGRGSGGSSGETSAWAIALVAILNEILKGVGSSPIPPPGTGYEAEGGYYPREDHQAQIARAGAWRVCAEDETGGEAYIPLAESKRPRSVNILRQVAEKLG